MQRQPTLWAITAARAAGIARHTALRSLALGSQVRYLSRDYSGHGVPQRDGERKARFGLRDTQVNSHGRNNGSSSLKDLLIEEGKRVSSRDPAEQPYRPQSDTSWEGYLNPAHIEHLQAGYPHVQRPTLGQSAFLRAIQDGQDVFYKDKMGHGKTFAMCLAALRIASSPNDASGTRVLIMAPSQQLLRQINETILSLISPSSTSDNQRPIHSTDPVDNSRILLATPRTLSDLPDIPNLPDLQTIFIDEPDTSLGNLPNQISTRGTKTQQKRYREAKHHSPSICRVLDHLMGIQLIVDAQPQPPGPRKHMANPVGWRDFSSRKDIQTIWLSGTLTSTVKQVVRSFGWIRRGGAINLDFSAVPLPSSEKPPAMDHSSKNGSHETFSPNQKGISHNIVSINPSQGDSRIALMGQRMDPPATPSTSPSLTADIDETKIHPYMVATLADLIKSSRDSSPSPASMSLIVPPEGVSLDHFKIALEEFGISPTRLDEASLISPAPSTSSLVAEAEAVGPKILLARRSNIAGLHIPSLSTIYLLNGLAVSTALKSQKRKLLLGKDQHRFEQWYGVLTGRLGRLGMDTEVQDAKIYSLVLQGGVEETALHQMFERKN